MIKHALLVFSFMGISYLQQRRELRRREKQLQRWYTEGILEHFERHIACLKMIKDRAEQHQRALKGKLEILAAFYGSKLAIQCHIAE